jgi:hypothetical protein
LLAGVLLVLSSHDWDARRLDPSVWLGGRAESDGAAAGGHASTAAGIAAALGGEFELAERAELPRFTRHHARKFTVDVMEALLFRRSVSGA